MKRREFIKSTLLLPALNYLPRGINEKWIKTAVKMAETMFPSDLYNVEVAQTDFSRRIAILLNEMPALYRFLVKTGFKIIEYSTIFSFHFRRFSSLSLKDRREILRGWEESTFVIKKNIFYGLKTIICGIYYSLPEVRRSMGFTYPCNSTGITMWEEG